MATLREIEEAWSIDDLADAHEILDLQEELEEKAARELRRRG